jgi:hypothetical protein
MLRCSEACRIQWSDAVFNPEMNARGVPKTMIITIRALEDDTFKTHQCSVEFNFTALASAGKRWCVPSKCNVGLAANDDEDVWAFRQCSFSLQYRWCEKSFSVHSIRKFGR